MNIIVTGGLGFIGTNLIDLIISKGHQVLNIDKETYASNKHSFDSSSYKLEKGDLVDIDLLGIFEKFNPDGIIHCAAESHVDNSIINSMPFIESNIIGTYKLIEAVRLFNKDLRFLHMSTDEVYGSLDIDSPPFNEKTRYDPSSPYSSSKASSDLIINAWQRTYSMNTVITNCSNNFGPWQHKEKLIPKTIYSIQNNLPIEIYGNGKNIRDWIFVCDHCKYIYKIFMSDKKDENYNIGGLNEITNNDLIKKIILMINKETGGKFIFEDIVSYVEDRKGHDIRYAVEMKKTINTFDNLLTNFDDNLKSTIKWHLKK